MANINQNSKLVFKGVNGGNLFQLAVLLSVASAANGDTITIAATDGTPLDAVPVSAVAYTAATPAVAKALTITSVDQTTGQIILTNASGGAIAVGSKIVIMMSAA